MSANAEVENWNLEVSGENGKAGNFPAFPFSFWKEETKVAGYATKSDGLWLSSDAPPLSSALWCDANLVFYGHGDLLPKNALV